MIELTRPIKFSFLGLFFFTPLIFTSSNSELFELPKTYFLYAAAIIISCLHFINYLQGKSPLIRRHYLNIPLCIFLLSQTVSTLFSVDTHTSLFGYYSRLNGGLLSLLAYLALFEVLIVYLEDNFKDQLLYTSLAAGTPVSLFAIAQHFGIDKHIWLQDVQSRVFSTLGQPNWLAAYLCILLPFALHFYLKTEKILLKVCFGLLTIIFYLALLYTKSKSGIAAALISLVFYLSAAYLPALKLKKITSLLVVQKTHFLVLTLLLLSFLINNPIKDYTVSLVNNLIPSKQTPPAASPGTPANTNLLITPSEDIRKIVWQGAWQLWQKFPLFGTGVETFAYSYYWTRPASHNLTSEWDYLYNKAHNEYLNYLATTGIFGFAAYLALIIVILATFLKSARHSSLAPAYIAALLSILITNIAGFTVVIVSLYFFTLPALALPPASPTDPKNAFTWPRKLSAILFAGFSFFLLGKTLFFYLADITYADAQKWDSRQEYEKALSHIKISLDYNPSEPVYLSFYSSQAAKLAVVNSAASSEKSQAYINDAVRYSNSAVSISPANINLLKERAQMFYYLSTLDSKYFQDAIDTLLKITYLAPTDAKTYYLIGKFLEAAGSKTDALDYYQKAIDLKSNYDHAYFAKAVILFDQKNYTEAAAYFQSTLKIAPNNQDAKDYLQKINSPPPSPSL